MIVGICFGLWRKVILGFGLSRNKKSSESIGELDIEERRSLAGSWRLTESTMLALADDEDRVVLHRLAVNPTITTKAQTVLAKKIHSNFASFYLVFNRQLKLTPATIMYCSGSKATIDNLRWEHPGLYLKIIRLEERVSKNKNFSFLKLVNEQQQIETRKRLLIVSCEKKRR